MVLYIFKKKKMRRKENISNCTAFFLKKKKNIKQVINGSWVFKLTHWCTPITTKTPELPPFPVCPRPSFTSSRPHTARQELKQHFVPSLMSVSPHWAKNNNLICVIGEKIWPDFTMPQKQGKWKKMSPRAHTMFHTDICMHNPNPWSPFFPSKTNLCPAWATW